MADSAAPWEPVSWASELDPFDLTPRFRSAGDATAPIRTGVPALGVQPLYSVSGVASWFALLSLRVELDLGCGWAGVPVARAPFAPASPWHDLVRVRARPPERAETSHAADLEHRLVELVSRKAADALTLGVVLHLDLGTLALLRAVAVAAARDERRVVVGVVDEEDDTGAPLAPAARAIAAAIAPASHVLLVDPASREPRAWSALGPGAYGRPRLDQALDEQLREAGAEVIFDGFGADQLLAAPAGLGGGRGRRATVPKAAVEPSPILTEWAAGVVLATENAVASSLDCRSRDASAAHAREMRFPLDPPEHFGVTRVSPYVDPAFARWAFDIPLRERFDRRLGADPLRRRALFVHLLRDAGLPALDPLPTTFAAHARYWQLEIDRAPRLQSLGILRPDWPARHTDAYELALVRACEDWVRGAEERGAVADRVV